MSLEQVSFTYHGRQYWIRVNPESHIGGRILNRNEPYEIDLLEDMFIHSTPYATALDIGAHIGNHTLWLATVCQMDVVAFEPYNADYAALTRNVELNGVGDEVRVVEAALGDRLATVVRRDGGRYEIGSSGVPMFTLDGWAAEHDLGNVALVKMDVEGAEPNIIAGGLHVIEEHQPVIYAEARTHDGRLRNAAALEPLGYRMTTTFSSMSVPTPVDRWEPT